MADYKAPLDDLKFILFDVLKVQNQWAELGRTDDWDVDTTNAILDEAAKLCEQEIAPLNQPADAQGCRYVDGQVISPDGFKETNDTFNAGGWAGLGGNPEYGGMGMPKAVVSAVEEMLQGACMSYGLAPMLTAGACLALDLHGSETLKKQYLDKMYSGQWSGAMDLTEPHAGTDLGMMRTKAEPVGEGRYRINGSKIFITWGEHDMAENIIHLVLARVDGAPPGNKGISLFLVPKFLPNEAGEVGQRNGVHCGAIEQKMGIKGSATCVMNFDNATGFLVGEENKGLANMFTMMNYERVAVGIQALATAHWSYTNAVGYAQERLQGKGPLKAEQGAPNNLLAHPDVRRMLMTSKAYLEGGRAFYLYVASWLDLAKYSVDSQSRATANARVALLTPVVKAFLTDTAFDVAVLGQQVLGGHGYIKEWGQEQFVRDIRITQIYEGTNGVQAMDLCGRKTVASNGELLNEFIEEMAQYWADHKQCVASWGWFDGFADSLQLVTNVTETLIQRAKGNPAEIGAVAVDYLSLLGHVSLAYMWLRMVVSAEQSDDEALKASKRLTSQYYFQRLLPKLDGLAAGIDHGLAGLDGMSAELW